MSDIDDIEHWIQDLSDPYHVVQKKEAAIKALREHENSYTINKEHIKRIAELELINQNYRLGGQHKQDDWLELIDKCERLDAALGLAKQFILAQTAQSQGCTAHQMADAAQQILDQLDDIDKARAGDE